MRDRTERRSIAMEALLIMPPSTTENKINK